MTFETCAGFIAGRVVTVARSLLEPTSAPWIEHEDQRLALARVDPEENARRARHRRETDYHRGQRGLDVPFDPPGALLDALVGRGKVGAR